MSRRSKIGILSIFFIISRDIGFGRDNTRADTGVDTRADSRVDTGADTGADTGVDTGVDTGADAAMVVNRFMIALGSGMMVSCGSTQPQASNLCRVDLPIVRKLIPANFGKVDNTVMMLGNIL
mmetsp:Transcript_1401/g.1596  ORF Transcript_1401/g.1596 Transcript_1401/m.1596 type:complete len:123 (-) Transcript_1401:287-655(-)